MVAVIVNDGVTLPPASEEVSSCLLERFDQKDALAYGVLVSMFDFHRRDRGSNPGRGGKIS